jgi:hypothetical protein
MQVVILSTSIPFPSKWSATALPHRKDHITRQIPVDKAERPQVVMTVSRHLAAYGHWEEPPDGCPKVFGQVFC